MRLFILSLMAALGFLITGSAKAEYGCQSGFVPVYQGNRQVCVADYNLSVWKQQGGQQQQLPAEIWEDRYGAVARSNNKSDYFVSVDQESKRKAKQAALSKCGSNCRIMGTFTNGCLSATWGGGMSYFKGAETKEQSEKAAHAACSAEFKGECKLVFSACSLPVRVQ